MTFEKVRQKHQQFIYEGFKIEKEAENLKITFDFLLTPDIYFKPSVIFPNISKKRLDEISPKVLENLAFNLGMMELLSYWKAACSPEIIIRAGYLDKEQIKFWKNLLIKGLGEFFYTNKIDFTKDDLVKFVSESRNKITPFKDELKDRDLVLVGGGKDSAVTLEIISKSDRVFIPLVLNPSKAAKDIAEIDSCCVVPTYIKRTIDPKLLQLNKGGYLNGHTPFSAYLAFLGVMVSVLYDFRNIIVSNESSSNEGNTKYLGQEINHQYSKSFEFEKLFREYCHRYLSLSSNYFSFLRPLNELQIAKPFSKMTKYHRLFRSCNRGSKLGIWCGECSKCISTYLILFPFLGKETEELFGKNLLEDKALIPQVKELLREDDKVKPFECVATIEEIKEAIYLGIERAKKDGQNTPAVLEAVKDKALNNLKLLKSWNRENNLPSEFEGLLKDYLKSFLILGFGREGKSTLKFLNKFFPFKNIGVVDKAEGNHYLQQIKNYDVIIKSPGIPYLPEIQKAKDEGKIITSATKIFFENFNGKIIGVTGTKGKSTLASLIYEVLKKGGIDVYLVGNIGKPALDMLDKLNENSVVVFELSSFQLEDLDKSPHIAVITNIYPEHLDHHKDFEDYQKAKFNITKYQTRDDYFIYDKNITQLKEFAKRTHARILPFSDSPIAIIGNLFKIPKSKVTNAVKNFKPLPHRLEFIGEFKGVKFYNDSLSTIPQATIRALDILGESVETLIVGGFDRGIDYSILGPVIKNSNIRNLILFPTTGEKIWQVVKKFKVQSSKFKVFRVKNMKDAVRVAFEETTRGKIVLLSPASSSFNLFRDYEDRGNQFKKLVSQF